MFGSAQGVSAGSSSGRDRGDEAGRSRTPPRALLPIYPPCRDDVALKLHRAAGDGQEGLLGIRVSGDLIGELGVVRSTRRSATVTTCAPALMHAFRQDVFLNFLSQHIDAWRVISSMIADRLDWANQARLEFAGHDVLTRVSRVLALLAERHGRPVPQGLDLGVPLSQEELGRLVGARRDSVVKALHDLRRQNIITTSYRRTIITHLDNLRRHAQLTS